MQHHVWTTVLFGNIMCCLRLLYHVTNVLFRFWDLAYPERSYIVAGGANDSLHCPSVFYNRKIIEGTEVVQV